MAADSLPLPCRASWPAVGGQIVWLAGLPARTPLRDAAGCGVGTCTLCSACAGGLGRSRKSTAGILSGRGGRWTRREPSCLVDNRSSSRLALARVRTRAAAPSKCGHGQRRSAPCARQHALERVRRGAHRKSATEALRRCRSECSLARLRPGHTKTSATIPLMRRRHAGRSARVRAAGRSRRSARHASRTCAQSGCQLRLLVRATPGGTVPPSLGLAAAPVAVLASFASPVPSGVPSTPFLRADSSCTNCGTHTNGALFLKRGPQRSGELVYSAIPAGGGVRVGARYHKCPAPRPQMRACVRVMQAWRCSHRAPASAHANALHLRACCVWLLERHVTVPARENGQRKLAPRMPPDERLWVAQPCDVLG